ncbi:MAG TPA: Ig-like domain-containing protein [Thermoanaerobaculia bacterium]|jgi:hypothetical protein|nr:Ig-like domain-containing protein [Thermoanaerobaculia bacterium]
MTRQRTLRSLSCSVALAAVLAAALFPSDASAARGGRRRPPPPPQPPSYVTGAAFVPPGFSPVVLFASNSIALDQGSRVLSGDVVVNTGGSEPTLGCANRRLCVGVGVTTPAGYTVKADSIQVKNQGAIFGTAFCNSLLNNGSQPGLTCSPLSLPVFATPPAFAAEEPRPAAADVSVPAGGSATLPPGDYGVITAGQNGVVTFTGGIYNVREINSGKTTSLRFQGHSEVRVEGKFSLDQNSFIGPAAGFGLTASDIGIFVAGINGSTGALGASPQAAKIGGGCVAQASFYVPNGTLHVQQNANVTGAFLARDVQVGPGAQVTLESFFANHAPTANPQDVTTSGAAPLTITLTGSDPDGDDLVFSIASGPTHGSLGAVTQGPPPSPGDPPGCSPDDCTTPPVPPRSSATVIYTPATADNLEDSFVFTVQDPGGKTGMAPVHINPPGDSTTPDPPLTTVVARDVVAEAVKDHGVVVKLKADAPAGVEVAFAIVAGSGPHHGTLSALTPGSESPQRSATVTYTPEAGFIGGDSFDFSACGTIGGTPSCDTGTATVTVVSGNAVAEPQEVETPADHELTIALGGSSGVPPSSLVAGKTRFVITGKAQLTDGAAVAGNVADADGDHLGDNHNALPGATPGLMAAAVDASGGAGSNGVLRMQIEWNVSGIKSLAESLSAASVSLHTNKGTVDSLATSFVVGTADQDGALTDSDFEAPATPLAGVSMPVPEGPTGSQGSFSFNILTPLSAALRNDTLDTFSVQGRVDESLVGQGFQRGLQVYTTASGNLPDDLEPQLEITTGAPAAALTFSILTLPTKGTLKTSTGATISEVPATLADNLVVFTPGTGTSGTDEFLFQVNDGFTVASARIGITISHAGCVGGFDPNGRPCT